MLPEAVRGWLMALRSRSGLCDADVVEQCSSDCDSMTMVVTCMLYAVLGHLLSREWAFLYSGFESTCANWNRISRRFIGVSCAGTWSGRRTSLRDFRIRILRAALLVAICASFLIFTARHVKCVPVFFCLVKEIMCSGHAWPVWCTCTLCDEDWTAGLVGTYNWRARVIATVCGQKNENLSTCTWSFMTCACTLQYMTAQSGNYNHVHVHGSSVVCAWQTYIVHECMCTVVCVIWTLQSSTWLYMYMVVHDCTVHDASTFTNVLHVPPVSVEVTCFEVDRPDL